MNQPGSADLLGVTNFQMFGQHTANHRAAQRVFPKLHVLILHQFENRGTDNQDLDNIKAQKNDGATQRTDPLRETVKSGVG